MPSKNSISSKGPIPKEFIIEKTLSGICKAQKDYEDWSGGGWLYEAPESLQTVYIAREIFKKIRKAGHSMSLTFENHVETTMKCAG